MNFESPQIPKEEAGEAQPAGPFSPEGFLNRNFGREKRTQATDEIPQVPEQAQEPAPVESTKKIEDKEKPIMQLMVEAYERLRDNPESAAYDALYDRLNPNLPEEEKMRQMARLTTEYRLFKEGKDWRQAQ
ncbi:MAG: hypothetical protein ACYCZ7_00675 [Minisyncoccota bacterium]